MNLRTAFFFATLITGFVAAPAGALAFDHTYNDLSALLRSTVIDGRVDYQAIKADPSVLTGYLDQAAEVEQAEFDRWSQSQQLAFLINVYNAATIELIIEHYPVKSIKDIGGLFSSPWKIAFVDLLGQVVSLDYIERDMIRERYREPRIHFALVCASKGCPSLRSEAYIPERLDDQLDEQTMITLLNSPEKNRYDATTNTLYLSPIFKWYRSDFEQTAGSVLSFVGKYIPESAKKNKPASIEYTNYDWSINSK